MDSQERLAHAYPEQYSDWYDAANPGRHLHITEVVPRDRRGREIRGLVRHANLERDYATDLATFLKVWRPA